jgi:transcription antitermination factor NusG
MSFGPFIYPGGHASGEVVTVVDGTFKGMPGKVVSPDEAVALRDQFGGEPSIFKAPPGKVWVALTLFGRTVPVLLAPSQIAARPADPT